MCSYSDVQNNHINYVGDAVISNQAYQPKYIYDINALHFPDSLCHDIKYLICLCLSYHDRKFLCRDSYVCHNLIIILSMSCSITIHDTR